MGRALIAGLVGGILMFAWGAVSHMALPLWDEALLPMPPQHEPRVLDALRGALPDGGVYFVPGHRTDGELTEEEWAAWEARAEAGPGALLVWSPGGAAVMGARTLGLELASNVLAAFVVALVLAAMRTGFLGRLLAATLIGVVGWLSIGASHWIWYSFPSPFARAELLDQLGGWFVSGLALAGIVRSCDDPRR
jgi:hypothetical protein